eukprot:CAMPEP_0172755894 /NCGR_PEP_ID=MMETSP1074-20121228/160703_1 /TAXON_ID=2916 /ORGANISM="Ceratium fusus, Strain PA161109" /LENGTH=162 /DNA_ID=CAMNT_0013589071 /DNA_START=963 /DNA_END=1450 /DNA_ORIENTATION=-
MPHNQQSDLALVAPFATLGLRLPAVRLDGLGVVGLEEEASSGGSLVPGTGETAWEKVVAVHETSCSGSSTLALHPPLLMSEHCVVLAGRHCQAERHVRCAALADLHVRTQVPPLVPEALVHPLPLAHTAHTLLCEALWHQGRWQILRSGDPKRCVRRKSSHI